MLNYLTLISLIAKRALGLGGWLPRGLSQMPLTEVTPSDSPPPAEVLSLSGNVLYTLWSAVHTRRVQSTR